MKTILTLVLFLKLFLADAQYPSVFFNNLGLNQGLSQSCVVDIEFDTKGMVWLATQDGLNRYDGKDFLVMDKKFDDITTSSSTRLGKVVRSEGHFLYIITKGGFLEKFDLTNGVFEAVNISLGKVKQVATCLLADENGKLWIGTASGTLMLYDGATAKIIKALNLPITDKNPTINTIFKDWQNQLWVVGGYLGFLNKKQTGFVAANMLGIKNRSAFSCLAEDGDDNLWLGSLGNGLFLQKKNESSFVQFKGYGKVPFPAVLVVEAILADNAGKVWAGTYGKGLFIINNKKETVDQLVNEKRNPASLPFNDVLSIKQDVNNGIWVGTDGGGVSYFNGSTNNFILFNNQTVPENIEIAMVRSVVADTASNIWVGTTNKGLTQINYKKASFKTWHFPSYKKDIFNPDRIVSLFNDREHVLWLGTQGNGLILFNPKKEKIVKWFHPESSAKLNLPDGTVWCMWPAANDKVWVGTGSNGLCLMDKQMGMVGKYLPDNPSHFCDAVRCIEAVSDTCLCIGFEKTGIQFFNTITKTFRPISKTLNDFFDRETNVKCLYFHDHILWIGTGGRGILTYNLQTGETKQLTDKDGLPNNTVYGILPDTKGYLWASTNKGLSRFSPTLINNKLLSAFTNYTSAQGLQSNEFNTGAYCLAPYGKLLFGGINGLNLFDPAELGDNNTNIPVAFTKILVDNEPILYETAAPFKKKVSLTYQNHSISFSFAASDFFSSLQFHYYYQLEGYDKQWIDANQRNYASYTNVPVGQYNFLVKYIKPGSADNANVARMGMDIQGPVWRKAWFIVLMVLLFFVVVYLLYRYRLAQVLKLFMVRQGIATDLHDDIGSTLSNINILSELSKKSLQDPAQAYVFLERISEQAQTSSQSLDDIIWSVNTKNDSWEETFSRMRRYAAEIFENNGTSYIIKLEEPTGPTKLRTEKRRDVFLIYKEILTNIHKHAAATEVEINMSFQAHQLIINIHDNGRGFDKNAHTHRNGLKNLGLRVARWKGEINIDTNENGTHIKICI